MKSKRLIFFVGNSGSGKDSLMKTTARILEENGFSVHIVKRYITRPQHASEDFHSIDKDTFQRMKQNGEFAISWFIYDTYYGCPISFEDHLRKDEYVFANVSREQLFDSRKKYPDSKIVLVEVPKGVAEERVATRGREEGKALTDRIQRMDKEIPMPSPDIVISNDIALEEAAMKLFNQLCKKNKK